MKANRQPAPRRRPMLLGPGTVMALVAALYLIGSGWLKPHGQAPGDAGRIVYQADTQGRLQRVQAPFAPPGPPGALPRLWKPEVGSLLREGTGLLLQPEQRRRISALAASWSRDKAGIEDAMRGATDGVRSDLNSARPGRGAAVALIQHGLGDYPALSREYDARRADYWLRGLAVLTPEQRKRAEAGSDPAQGATR